MSKLSIATTVLVVCLMKQLVKADEVTEFEKKFEVPAKERLVLYWDQLKELNDSLIKYNKLKDERLPFLMSPEIYQRLADKLDAEFVKSLEKPRFDPQAEDVALIKGFLKCDMSGYVIRVCTTPGQTKEAYHECAKDKHFHILMRYLHLMKFNVEDLTMNEVSCASLEEGLDKESVKECVWETRAFMSEQFNRITNIFIKSVIKVADDFIQDYEYVKAVFFPEASLIEIIDYSQTSGDEHKDTGNVAILTLRIDKNENSPKKIVYKPSSVMIDWLIAGETKSFCRTAYTFKDLKDNKMVMLCEKFKKGLPNDEVENLGSFMEMLNKFTQDPSTKLKTYNILPIENLNQDISDEVILSAEEGEKNDRETLDEYMKKRVQSSHGYIKFLESKYTVDINPYEIVKILSENPRTNLEAYYYEKLSEQIKDPKVGFELEDIPIYMIKVGKLLEMLHLISSPDAHSENFIVNFKEPCLIDFEHSFDPRNPDFAKQEATKIGGGFNILSSMPVAFIYTLFYNKASEKMEYIQHVKTETNSQPILNPSNKSLPAFSDYYKNNFEEFLNEEKEVKKNLFDQNQNKIIEGENIVKNELRLQKSSPNKTNYFLKWIESPIMNDVIVRGVFISTNLIGKLTFASMKIDNKRTQYLVKSARLLQKAIEAWTGKPEDSIIDFNNLKRFEENSLESIVNKLITKGKEFINLDKVDLSVFVSSDEEIFALHKGLVLVTESLKIVQFSFDDLLNFVNEKFENSKFKFSTTAQLADNLRLAIASTESLDSFHNDSIENAFGQILRLFTLYQHLLDDFKKKHPKSASKMIVISDLEKEDIETFESLKIEDLGSKVNYALLDDPKKNRDFLGRSPLVYFEEYLENLPDFKDKVQQKFEQSSPHSSGLRENTKAVFDEEFEPRFFEKLRLKIASQSLNDQVKGSFYFNALAALEIAKGHFNEYFQNKKARFEKLNELAKNIKSAQEIFPDKNELFWKYSNYVKNSESKFGKKADPRLLQNSIKFFKRGIEFYNAAKGLKKRKELLLAESVVQILIDLEIGNDKYQHRLLLDSNIIDFSMKNVIPAYYTLARSRFLYSSFGDNVFYRSTQFTDVVGAIKGYLDYRRSIEYLSQVEFKQLKRYESKLTEIENKLETFKSGLLFYEKSPLKYITEHIHNYAKESSKPLIPEENAKRNPANKPLNFIALDILEKFKGQPAKSTRKSTTVFPSSSKKINPKDLEFIKI